MGDRTNAEITVGGTLRTCCADEFLSVLEDEGIGPDYNGRLDTLDELEAHLQHLRDLAEQRTPGEPPPAPCFGGNEVNYGRLDVAEAFCQRRGLPYRQHWDAGGDYGAGNTYWFPGDAAPSSVDATEDGTDMVPLYLLRGADWRGKTVADVLAHYAPVLRPIPPLELVAPIAGGVCPGCLAEALLPGAAVPEDYAASAAAGAPRTTEATEAA